MTASYIVLHFKNNVFKISDDLYKNLFHSKITMYIYVVCVYEPLYKHTTHISILTGNIKITTSNGRAERPSNHLHGSWSILVITNRASSASNTDPVAQAICNLTS